MHIGSGIHFRTTYKIGIEISAVSHSFLPFLPILHPCVEQRNTTLYAMLDLNRLLMSEVNPTNTKVLKEYYFGPMSCNSELQAVRRRAQSYVHIDLMANRTHSSSGRSQRFE